MNTDRHTSLRVPLLVSCIAFVLAGAGDVRVSCSPTLTCSMHPERFAPPPDAGANTCRLGEEACALKEISLGARHTCVRTEEDNVLCWGDDAQHQRGATLAGRAESERFAHVADRVLQVSAGAEHTCALKHDGSVSCWGSRAHGQVDGRADPTPSDVPQPVQMPRAWAIAAGAAHTCAIANDFVWCWGSSQYGQAGRSQTDAALLPGPVPLTHGAVEIAAGVRHTCARLDTLDVVCWGELIDAQGKAFVTPEARLVLKRATRLAAGGGHSCATDEFGMVLCWGHNANGQLGDGTTLDSGVPVRAQLSGVALTLAAGGGEADHALFGHTCALAADGDMYCWGNDAHGQLGIGAGADSPLPVRVRTADGGALGRALQLSLGAAHGCELTPESEVYCWGDDSYQQLGLDLSPGAVRPSAAEPSPPVRIPSFGNE